jgi:cAMP phosphodiesterase
MLIFRTEISHIRNGTNIIQGISNVYLDEITFFMNFTAQQLEKNNTTGLQKSLSIDREVIGNLTISGLYFTNTLWPDFKKKNFFAWRFHCNNSQDDCSFRVFPLCIQVFFPAGSSLPFWSD